jgi:sugar O-acyltransferase (sialic acid O-acetyltransferase NeuD family)
MKRCIIIGASGHAKVVTDIFEKQGLYHIIGFIDAKKTVSDSFMGYPILGAEETLPELISSETDCFLFIAIGDNYIRGQVKNRISEKLPDAKFATAIHPSAQIGKDVSIGEGSVIMAGAIINPCTIIGAFVILNTRSSVDHDNHIEDFASLAPNATTGGNVTIGSYSALSISATVKHGVNVGNHTVIGGSAFVNKHLPDQCIAFGIPAKCIRNRTPGERYL